MHEVTDPCDSCLRSNPHDLELHDAPRLPFPPDRQAAVGLDLSGRFPPVWLLYCDCAPRPNPYLHCASGWHSCGSIPLSWDQRLYRDSILKWWSPLCNQWRWRWHSSLQILAKRTSWLDLQGAQGPRQVNRLDGRWYGLHQRGSRRSPGRPLETEAKNLQRQWSKQGQAWHARRRGKSQSLVL